MKSVWRSTHDLPISFDMLSTSVFFSVLALASSLIVDAAALKAPALVTGTVHYNVSEEHKHIFGARLQTVHNKRTCASYNTAAEGQRLHKLTEFWDVHSSDH